MSAPPLADIAVATMRELKVRAEEAKQNLPPTEHGATSSLQARHQTSCVPRAMQMCDTGLVQRLSVSSAALNDINRTLKERASEPVDCVKQSTAADTTRSCISEKLQASSSHDKKLSHDKKDLAAHSTDPNPQHNLYSGPPVLRSSNSFGLSLRRELGEPITDLSALAGPPCVYVDWGSLEESAGENVNVVYTLTLRHRGRPLKITRASGPGAEMRVELPRDAAGSQLGVPFVAHLCWSGGERFLHVLPQLPSAALKLTGLFLPPRTAAEDEDDDDDDDDDETRQSEIEDLLTAVCTDSEREPRIPAHAAALERGFGIEIEVLTEDCNTLCGYASKTEQIRSILNTLVRAAEAQAEEERERGRLVISSHSLVLRGENTRRRPDRVDRLEHLVRGLTACLSWATVRDTEVAGTSAAIARRTVAAWLAGAQADSTPTDSTQAYGTQADRTQLETQLETQLDAPTRERWRALLTRSSGATLQSEFRSPPPPHELRFSSGAELQISCFVHGALASVGAGASSIRADGHSCTQLHVHVNCGWVNQASGGSRLSVAQLYNVVFWWIRFDLVTGCFARPWLWRDHSAAPLYASGAEFEYHEAVWEQGSGLPPSGAVQLGEDVRRRQYDVPTFVRAAYAKVRERGYEAWTEEEKRVALLEASENLSRYTSLNIASPLKRFGTLEFRRFHSTLDAALLARWAHFCVSFVETFREVEWPLLERGESVEDVLAELRVAQEGATAEELMSMMEGRVDDRLARYFEEESALRVVEPQGPPHTSGGARAWLARQSPTSSTPDSDSSAEDRD